MDINCVSNDFWEKPVTIDFTDKKFGYCAIAVFSKKGEFQRTYMIPDSVRARVIDRKNMYDSYGCEFYNKNQKAYNMCVHGACSFDNERAIMQYYNKSEENFSKKRVYAIYFNLYKIFLYDMSEKGAFLKCINYVHQMYGEYAELSTDDIEAIYDDLNTRVFWGGLYSLTGNFNYCVNQRHNTDISSDMIQSLKAVYSLFDVYQDGTQNTVLTKNKQILCDMHGVKMGEFDSAYLTVLTNNILVIAAKTKLIQHHERTGVKEYTNILVNHYILNIKCFYHIYRDIILESFKGESLQSALCGMIKEYSGRVNFSFHNKRKLCESFISGLKLMAVSVATNKLVGHIVNRYRNNLLSGPYHFTPRRSTEEFALANRVFTDYFGENKEEFCQEFKDTYISPKPDFYRTYGRENFTRPEGNCLPLMLDHTPDYKTEESVSDLVRILNNLCFVFGNSRPMFPVYDGKVCALLSVGVVIKDNNANAKLNEIFIIGGDV